MKSFSCLPVIIRLIVVIRVEIVENENLSVLLQSLGNPFDRLPVVTRSSVKEAFSILLDELCILLPSVKLSARRWREKKIGRTLERLGLEVPSDATT